MQTKQQETPTGFASENSYRQQLDREVSDLRKRTRRQFFAAAGVTLGGAALALGGLGIATHSFDLRGPGQVPACSPQGTPLSPAHPQVLKVCQLNKSINFFAFYVAQQQGYFTAEGLSIANPPLLQVGPAVVKGVESGQYDIGNGVITDAFTWANTDASARIIGSFMNGYVVDVVVSKQFEQEMQVSASSPLDVKIRALKGRTIGITGPKTGTQALLIYLFRLQGMDALKDCVQVSLGSNNGLAITDLQNGKVDAVSLFSPVGQMAESAGIGDIFISAVRGDVPGLRGDVHGICYTRQSVIDAKPQAIAAYIRAINKAEALIQNDAEATKKLLNSYLGLGQDVASRVYTTEIAGVAKNPQIGQATYNVAGQFHVQAGLVSLIPSYNKLVASSFIDSALGIGAPLCK